MDVIKPITNAPAIAETRMTRMILRNFLDAKGLPGTPGKYQVIIETIDEQQDASRVPIANNGTPVRTTNPPIVFDPMDYNSLEVTRPDNSTFYLGYMLVDMLAAIERIMEGLPPPPPAT